MHFLKMYCNFKGKIRMELDTKYEISMFNNLIPLNKKLYLKVFVVVFTLVVVGFLTAVLAFNYELTPSDPFGSFISSLLLAYLVHLMIWQPGEE